MKRPILLSLLLLLFLCKGSRGFSQQRSIDSLVTLSYSVPDSVDRFKIYLELSILYKPTDTVSSKLYRLKANQLLSRFTNEKKALQAYLIIAKHDLNLRKYEEALSYSTRALTLAKKTADQKYIATAYYYMGCIYLSKGDSKKALDYFIQSSRIADNTEDNELKAHLNSSFGVIYQQQNKFDSALVYFKKSMNYLESNTKNDEYRMTGLQNIGGILIAQGSYEEGQAFFKKALELAKTRRDKYAEVTILFNISNGYQREGDFIKAEPYTLELVKEAEKNGFILLQAYGKTLLATLKMDQKEYDAGISQSKEALILANKENLSSLIMPLYDILVTCYEGKQDYKKALEYRNLSIGFKDSLSSIENTNYIEELKQKYNLQQKNRELGLKTDLIQQVEKSNRQKTFIIISLLIVCLSATLSLFFYNQRRKIKEELIQKDRYLESQTKHFEAFINGQEQERKRIASDLHDGLAQNLVILKMGISNIKPSEKEQQEEINAYAHEIDLLIEETRKISHDMMPDVLVDLGLQRALKSLINGINKNHPTLTIQFVVTEPFTNITPDTEIQLYRVIQELLNNIIKHSFATTCEITLSSTDTMITVAVKDNGKGFDQGAEKKGIGLQNIDSRVKSLKGTLQITTHLNQGTIVNINVPVA